MNAPDLFTSYWSNPELRKVHAAKLCISRGVPRWPLPFRYRRANLLAPSRETFALQSDEAFEREYLRELDEAGAEKIAAMLARISREEGGGPLVLLCWERPGEVCHRRTFAQWFEARSGQEVPELQFSLCPHKRQAAQPSLLEKGELEHDGN